MTENSGLPVYHLYGLAIRSEIALPAPEWPCDALDLDVRWGEGPASADPAPGGHVLLQRTFSNGQGYTLTETATGYTLRFTGVGEFRIDPARRWVHVHLLPDGDAGLAPILLAGNVIACILGLGGEHPLHASTVAVDGAALAFLGDSGRGKSTLATLLCAHGARLVTDDLLRLQATADGFRCLAGTAEVRLRANAAQLAEQFPPERRSRTTDGRVTVNLSAGAAEAPLLRAIIIPSPSRTCQTLRTQRMSPADALLTLNCHSRVMGWKTGAAHRTRFQTYGEIARRVPVYTADIPWGPPFDPALAPALLHTLKEANSGSAE